MAQFDVYWSPDESYWLDCQANLLAHLNTRLVVPLDHRPDAVQIDRRLNPVFEVAGHRAVMQTHFAAAVPVKTLTRPVASLAAHRLEIQAAFDMLLTGI